MKPMGKATDGIVSRALNRRVSTRISAWLVKHGVKDPNKVTVATGVLGILAPTPYLLVKPWSVALAGLLIQLASILDGVDGEIARMLGKTSRFGAFLDAIVDRLVDIVSIILACYALAVALGFKPWLLVLTGLALSADLMVSYLHARGEASLGKSPILIGKLRCWASRDVRLFILCVSSMLILLAGWYSLVAGLLAITILSYTYVFAKTVEIWLLWRKGVIT